ncbi:hypothetical protein CB1_000340059 [Camelus ferus]|nr:hypothetical protein CB1_000340059 [Camelus ferus]
MADVTLQWNKGERDSSIRNIQVVKPNGLEPAARGQETKPVSMYPSTLSLQSNTLMFVLQNTWSNNTLNLGSFGPRFLTFSVEGLPHNILADIIFREVEKFADSASSFGPQVTRHVLSECPLLSSRPTRPWVKTPLHGETLLVIPTTDSDQITLPFFTQSVSSNFRGHVLLIKGTKFTFIVYLNEFLAAGGQERDVQLHSEAADCLRGTVKKGEMAISLKVYQMRC